MLEAIHILNLKPNLNVTQEPYLLPTSLRQIPPVRITEHNIPANPPPREPRPQDQRPQEAQVGQPNNNLRRSQRLQQNRQ